MADNLPTLALIFDWRNIFLSGWWSGIIFFRLFLQFNHLKGRANKVVVKGFFHIGHESTGAIHIPTTGNRVHVWKFGNLHGRIHTRIGVDIHPIYKESWQLKEDSAFFTTSSR
jgi:hypothetical protein